MATKKRKKQTPSTFKAQESEREFYHYYLQKLVGGMVRGHRESLIPGQIVSFRYNRDGRGKKLPRIVFVLNKRNEGYGIMIHGINIETLPYTDLLRFLRRVLVKDVATLIKRRYEIRGPFKEQIDQAKSFYISHVKPNLIGRGYDCYRTYRMTRISDVKIWMLDWKRLFSLVDKEEDPTLISRTDKLTDIKDEIDIINELLKADISKLKDKKFEQLVIEKFESIEKFTELVKDISNYVEDDTGDEGDEELNAKELS